MSEQPLVSILCITYNHEKYIAQAIESFLMQEVNFSYEILIHDDASTDRTQSIIKKYEVENPSVIHVIYQTKNNRGLTAMPTLMQMAKGKYFAICEGDDYWTDVHKLSEQVSIMEAHSECTGCCHNTRAVNEQGVPHEGDIQTVHYKKEDAILDKSHLKANCRFCRTPSLMLRAEIMPKTDSEWEKYFSCKANGDMKWSAVVAATGKMYFIAKTMADYRYVLTAGSGSWNARNKDKNINLTVYNSLENIKEYIREVYDCELSYNDYYVWLMLNSFKQYVCKRTKQDWTVFYSLLKVSVKNGYLLPSMYHYIVRKIKGDN